MARREGDKGVREGVRGGSAWRAHQLNARAAELLHNVSTSAVVQE